MTIPRRSKMDISEAASDFIQMIQRVGRILEVTSCP